MREILFRGKRIDSGEWVFGMPWIFKEKSCICPWKKGMCKYDTGFFPVEVIPETVGQYTGKRDTKNNRIFDGDIIRIKWRTLDLAENAVVRYDDRSCAYILNMRGAAWSYMSHLDAVYMQIESFEVIGNMWDDPELMEGIQCG